LGAAVRKIIVEVEVSSLDPSDCHEPVAQSGQPRLGFWIVLRNTDNDRNPSHPSLLLCPRRQRPRRSRAAEKRDELAAAHYSITSSAATSNLSGIVRPSPLAALRLITNSNLVGC